MIVFEKFKSGKKFPSSILLNGAIKKDLEKKSKIRSFFEKEKYCGLLLEKEVVNLNKALNQNTTPSLAIIGGAKISSKIDVLYSLMNSVDKIIIGGGMAYTLLLI